MTRLVRTILLGALVVAGAGPARADQTPARRNRRRACHRSDDGGPSGRNGRSGVWRRGSDDGHRQRRRLSVRGSPARGCRAHLPAAEFRNGPAADHRHGGAPGAGRHRPAAIAERGRHRDRRPDVSQPRRQPESLRESGRHRLLGQPGGDHRGAARGAADHAGRRDSGDRPRDDRQPAQRRGEGQPVPTCAASTSIMAPTSRPPWPACRSTHPPVRTRMDTPTSAS